ncbi:hypothetical protein IDH44_10905 [Paenibacillus sp. IB182496]|uniref:Cthe-2314-like HEPN domain-containing protein n=1 Tax=Paenibacillus sabuli TaxID=2772509 RepID=A0A927GRJ0_9BACL|nr:Cthe_2314 family HEPN domain-containing protein [Paenibacillus sabuli]MBD2845699.1 hypothetical protein [Paenibacillus sabuli]
MLRTLLGQPPRTPEGRTARTIKAMEHFIAQLIQQREAAAHDYEVAKKLRTYEIWTLGLVASLDELEESRFASHYFASRIDAEYLSEMNEAELLDYARYVYFDKNAFIRIFSLLDKLGTLLNDLLALRTERMKRQFSYFTVVRRMSGEPAHQALWKRLEAVKEQHREPISRLRKRRNTEIHFMNSEMHDDLLHLNAGLEEEARLEDIRAQLATLDRGCEMVKDSLRLAFEYAVDRMREAR